MDQCGEGDPAFVQYLIPGLSIKCNHTRLESQMNQIHSGQIG